MLAVLLDVILQSAILVISRCWYWQVSVMRVFQQVLSDKEFRAKPNAAELISFCTSVVRSLFARLLPPNVLERHSSRAARQQQSNAAIGRTTPIELKSWPIGCPQYAYVA